MAGVTLDSGALIVLDRNDRRVVSLLARAHEIGADIVDAHVVICARRKGQTIATSDSDDLRRLDPALAAARGLTRFGDGR